MNWERICPVCNRSVSRADIDFADKLICLECRREEKAKMWQNVKKFNKKLRSE